MYVDVLQDKRAYKEYMEASGYKTLKELHNGAFFVDDFIFVSNKLYKSLRRRHVIDDDDEDVAPMKMKHQPAAGGAVNRPGIMQL